MIEYNFCSYFIFIVLGDIVEYGFSGVIFIPVSIEINV